MLRGVELAEQGTCRQDSKAIAAVNQLQRKQLWTSNARACRKAMTKQNIISRGHPNVCLALPRTTAAYQQVLGKKARPMTKNMS